MSEWLSGNLGDIADIVMGQSPTGESVNTNGLGVPLLNGPTEFTIRYPKAVQFSTDPKRFSKVNDILFCVRGSTTGRMNWADEDYAIGRGLAAIRHKQGEEYRYFVKAILDYYLDTMLASASGSTFPNVSKDQLNELEISYPSFPEQKAIASVLSSLDDKIDLLYRQNKTLEAMAETLFRQWFIEEAKEDWEEVPLSDYFKVKHGYAFKGEFITPEPTKYRLVTPGNFEIGGGFKSAKFKYYSSDVIPEDYVFNELDFVVTMTDLSKEGDTLGYPAFIPLHHKADVLYLHNQRVGKVQFYDEKECKFFFYMLMKQDVYQQFIVGSCTGTSVKHSSPTTIGSFTFAKPPQEKMHDFDRIVGQKFAKIFVNQKQIQTLENLRDTLLPKLMSGEVRVQYQTEEVA